MQYFLDPYETSEAVTGVIVAVFKTFVKTTGEQLCWSGFLNKVADLYDL